MKGKHKTMTALVQEIKEQHSSVEPYFHQFFQDVVRTNPKVDPELLIKIMMLQVNLKNYVGPDIPHVHLEASYKDGVDHIKNKKRQETSTQ